MPDWNSSLAGIAVLALATYLTRIMGYFLGGRIRPESLGGRVLDALPGAALASVLALTLVHASAVDLLAVLATVSVYLWSARTLAGIGAGLAVAVLHAHWLA